MPSIRMLALSLAAAALACAPPAPAQPGKVLRVAFSTAESGMELRSTNAVEPPTPTG